MPKTEQAKIAVISSLKMSDWLFLFLSWLLIQIALVSYLGINVSEESTKYIGIATQWLRGERNLKWNNLFYSGYIAIHIVLRLVGLPVKSLYGVQLLFSAVSTYFFIKTAGLFSKNRFVLICSGILYISCFFIQQWVSSLFTDSIFGSLLVIAVYYLLTEEDSKKNKLFCWILIFILPLFRPVGCLFLLLSGIYWTLLSPRRDFRKAAICSVFILFIAFVVKKSFENPEYFYPNHNLEANIICGYSDNLLSLQKVPYDPERGMLMYFADNPFMSFSLFTSRFLKIFTMTRDYFSPVHNFLLRLFTIFYLSLAVFGAVGAWYKFRKTLYFLISAVLIFCIPSVIFCQDWSGRFSIPVYVFVLLLSGLGIHFISEMVRTGKGANDMN